MSSKTSPSHASALHPPVGTLIDGGSLELVEVLGIGGYGVVYRAVDTRQSTVQKSYAVKCLIASGQQTARQRQIHIREIALHQLASAHPGVVTLHRVVDQGSHTFIIMDYAPDHDLFTQILHSCRYLGEDLLIKDIFLQLLDAVEYCHSLGIYHRDLKPENILCFDDGLRIAITDFGLATTDKVSDEFRTGSVYHMSPECQGECFAPTGNYSPMFNDIWSLGIILLNLATGRNPWKSATPSDPTFQAYLRDPNGFLPTVLPISPEVNEILVRMLDVDWRERSTLREVRYAIEGINNFYSDGVVFEGSMARCPWESGMDIDSASSGTSPDDAEPHSPVAQVETFPEDLDEQLGSQWSKDSTSDIVFATQSLEQGSLYGHRWTNYSSCGATWDYESPVSSDSEPDHFRMDVFERSSTPSSVQTAETSLPPTPNNLATFGSKTAKAELRSALLINTNISTPRIYDASTSMTSYSTGNSVMHTAIEYDPYSSMFFINSPISPGKLVMMPDSAITAVGEDKDMTSPTVWTASSATQASSLSSYSDSSVSSSVLGEDLCFSRSRTPSPEPDLQWTSFTQVQSLQPQQCQLSPSMSSQMTDVLPSSRRNQTFLFSFKHGATPTASNPSTINNSLSPTVNAGGQGSHRPNTLSRLAIKLFPRSASPSSPPSSSDTSLSSRLSPAKASHSPSPRGQTPSPAPHTAAWRQSAMATSDEGGSPVQHESDPLERPKTATGTQRGDAHHHHLRSTRHWYLPGRFRTSAEVN